MKYIVDTNIFIRSYHEMPMDIWVTFWRRIVEIANAGLLCSVVSVKDEIDRGGDMLTQWVKDNLPKDFFIPIDVNVLKFYADTQDWVRRQNRYKESAIAEFADVADAYLVAAAKANGYTVITYEKSDANSQKRVKIPDVCVGMDVDYCDLNTFLRDNNIQI